ncbi:MAG: MBL fold metallo-hydrolase, partial [Spirochaetaceae bacterium]|nr:MBL fold metallo-hydrolase [Spirochaetaceae bacterium]
AQAGEAAAQEENKKLHQFMQNADVLVYDSAYTEEEYTSGKINWGHTSYEKAISNGANANAKKLVLFHHDATRTDNALIQIEKDFCLSYNGNCPPEIMLAKEGLTLEA